MQIELLCKLNEIPGLNLAEDALSGKPGFKLDLLYDPRALQKFKAAIDWLVDRINRSSATIESLNGEGG